MPLWPIFQPSFWATATCVVHSDQALQLDRNSHCSSLRYSNAKGGVWMNGGAAGQTMQRGPRVTAIAACYGAVMKELPYGMNRETTWPTTSVRTQSSQRSWPMRWRVWWRVWAVITFAVRVGSVDASLGGLLFIVTIERTLCLITKTLDGDPETL